MDIVEFCEKVLNIQLLDFQKKLLRDMYEAGKNNQQFIFMPSRKHSIEFTRAIIDKFIRKQECLKEFKAQSKIWVFSLLYFAWLTGNHPLESRGKHFKNIRE